MRKKYLIIWMLFFHFITPFSFAHASIEHEYNEKILNATQTINEEKQAIVGLTEEKLKSGQSKAFYRKYRFQNNSTYQIFSHPTFETIVTLPKNFVFKKIANITKNIFLKGEKHNRFSLKITKGKIGLVTLIGENDQILSILVKNSEYMDQQVPYFIVNIN